MILTANRMAVLENQVKEIKKKDGMEISFISNHYDVQILKVAEALTHDFSWSSIKSFCTAIKAEKTRTVGHSNMEIHSIL